MKARTHNTIIAFLSALLLAGLAAYSLEGMPYFRSTAAERLELNPTFQDFSPSGLLGHGIGFLAMAFMLFLLLYILRKYWSVLRGAGRLSQWLKYHMWLGVMAPILAGFHASFKFEGLIGVMYWAIIAVALSGIVGRYLYGHIPRRKDGHELSRAQIDTERAARLRELQFEFGIKAEDIERISAISQTDRPGTGLFGLLTLPVYDLKLRRRIHTTLNELSRTYALPANDVTFFKNTLSQQIVLDHRILIYDTVTRIFHWWHVIHKPFAYAIFLVLALHVALTLSFGFTWIF